MNGCTSTLVLDIGKSNAKLVLIAADGRATRSTAVVNESRLDTEHGFQALGVARLQDWLLRSVPDLLAGEVPGRLSVTTHGAAFCAIADDGLVLPPIDYEWDGYDGVTAAFDASLANFAHHGTPRLGQGLNGGRQLDFVHRRWPAQARRIRYWLPYAQYWSWWLSGVACTEVSSLGCHTGLWAPAEGRYSDWAIARGIAERFAPLRPAWDVIGTLRPTLAKAWSLPAGVEVIAGAHDSNACLARHLRTHPLATVVSTGTWCIVMAPGADAARLAPERDELVNVAVDGRGVPTARFMGGREFATLCGGADPALATLRSLTELMQEGWMALPSFAEAGGPFAGRPGRILHRGALIGAGLSAVPERLRPALATIYCACLSALLVDDLAGPDAATTTAPVILEGPLAHNLAYGPAMAALLPSRPVLRATDPLEGTARGAWMLSHWQAQREISGDTALRPAACEDAALARAMRTHAQAWRERVALA
jgi:sugar (pentulose or hexulose) kinase